MLALQVQTALVRIAAGPALLHALGDRVNGAALERLGGACEASWQQRAVDVYREALSAGLAPRPHIIERVLACLRRPAAPRPALPAGLPSPFKVSLLCLCLSKVICFTASPALNSFSCHCGERRS